MFKSFRDRLSKTFGLLSREDSSYDPDLKDNRRTDDYEEDDQYEDELEVMNSRKIRQEYESEEFHYEPVEPVEKEDQYSESTFQSESLAESRPSGDTYVHRASDTYTQKAGSPPAEQPVRTTIIAEGTHIEGNVTMGGPAEIFGTVKGGIASRNNIVAAGDLVGNVVAANFTLRKARLVGDIVCVGTIKTDPGSSIQGDINADRAEIEGRLHGDMNVTNSLEFFGHANIQGNLVARSVQIHHGAVISGHVSIGLDKDGDSNENTAQDDAVPDYSHVADEPMGIDEDISF